MQPIAESDKRPARSTNFVWGLKNPWVPSRLTAVLAEVTKKHLKVEMDIPAYRRAALLIGKHFIGQPFASPLDPDWLDDCSTDEEPATSPNVLRAGGFRRGMTRYIARHDIVRNVTTGSLAKFRGLSEKWHACLGLESRWTINRTKRRHSDIDAIDGAYVNELRSRKVALHKEDRVITFEDGPTRKTRRPRLASVNKAPQLSTESYKNPLTDQSPRATETIATDGSRSGSASGPAQNASVGVYQQSPETRSTSASARSASHDRKGRQDPLRSPDDMPDIDLLKGALSQMRDGCAVCWMRWVLRDRPAKDATDANIDVDNKQGYEMWMHSWNECEHRIDDPAAPTEELCDSFRKEIQYDLLPRTCLDCGLSEQVCIADQTIKIGCLWSRVVVSTLLVATAEPIARGLLRGAGFFHPLRPRCLQFYSSWLGETAIYSLWDQPVTNAMYVIGDLLEYCIHRVRKQPQSS